MKKITLTVGTVGLNLAIASTCYAADVVDITQSVDADETNGVFFNLDSGSMLLSPSNNQLILNNNSVGRLNVGAKLELVGAQSVSDNMFNVQSNNLVIDDGEYFGTSQFSQNSVGNNLSATNDNNATPSEEIILNDVTQIHGGNLTGIDAANNTVVSFFTGTDVIFGVVDEHSQTARGNNVVIRSNKISGDITQLSNPAPDAILFGGTNSLLLSTSATIEAESIHFVNQDVNTNSINATADIEKLDGIYMQSNLPITTIGNLVILDNVDIDGGDMVTTQTVSSNQIVSSGKELELMTSQEVLSGETVGNSIGIGLLFGNGIETDGTFNYSQQTSGNSHIFTIK